jgi:hypothetical protein
MPLSRLVYKSKVAVPKTEASEQPQMIIDPDLKKVNPSNRYLALYALGPIFVIFEACRSK